MLVYLKLDRTVTKVNRNDFNAQKQTKTKSLLNSHIFITQLSFSAHFLTLYVTLMRLYHSCMV